VEVCLRVLVSLTTSELLQVADQNVPSVQSVAVPSLALISSVAILVRDRVVPARIVASSITFQSALVKMATLETRSCNVLPILQLRNHQFPKIRATPHLVDRTRNATTEFVLVRQSSSEIRTSPAGLSVCSAPNAAETKPASETNASTLVRELADLTLAATLSTIYRRALVLMATREIRSLTAACLNQDYPPLQIPAIHLLAALTANART
jgi:hypothetical protein